MMAVSAGAQTSEKLYATFENLRKLTATDFEALQIPPLEVLFKNAEQAPAVSLYETSVEINESQLKTVRRQWFDYIRGIATYTHGNSDLSAVSLMESTYSVWNQTSATQIQDYWNVGVSLSIPLTAFVDYGNKVKQQKARIEYAERQRQAELEIVKRDIISYYMKIINQISVLQVAAQAMVQAQVQYKAAEVNYLNGAITEKDLYMQKSFEQGAVGQYEACRIAIIESILCLEIRSHTPILTDLVSEDGEVHIDITEYKKPEKKTKK
ncbi:MAG: TolC family protein [Bacteroidales bacterium]|nr:TolC family protein [Bacteroidales bacterium]